LPSLSVVEAITEPDGLINTTTTFAIPVLFVSLTWPDILIMERRRDAAARKEVSDVGKASAGEAEGVGLGVGAADEEAGVAAGALSGFRVSILSDGIIGASVLGASLVMFEEDASVIGTFSGVAVVPGEGVAAASGVASG
jgi:hypothetical protein